MASPLSSSLSRRLSSSTRYTRLKAGLFLRGNAGLYLKEVAPKCLTNSGLRGPIRDYASLSSFQGSASRTIEPSDPDPFLTKPPLADSQRRTIYALATPPGKGGLAVVRVSGPDVTTVIDAIVKRCWARP